MFPTTELRFTYRIDGSDVAPRVAVRLERGQWHAVVAITDGGSSIHITRLFASSDEALVAAEAHIRKRYEAAALTRIRADSR